MVLKNNKNDDDDDDDDHDNGGDDDVAHYGSMLISLFGVSSLFFLLCVVRA